LTAKPTHNPTFVSITNKKIQQNDPIFVQTPQISRSPFPYTSSQLCKIIETKFPEQKKTSFKKLSTDKTLHMKTNISHKYNKTSTKMLLIKKNLKGKDEHKNNQCPD
jgi:hypothetical protein